MKLCSAYSKGGEPHGTTDHNWILEMLSEGRLKSDKMTQNENKAYVASSADNSRKMAFVVSCNCKLGDITDCNGRFLIITGKYKYIIFLLSLCSTYYYIIIII